jgi:hypothetical protein
MRLTGIIVVLVVGCGPGSGAHDTPDGSVDGMQGGAGMFVDWNANPALPGALNDKVSATSVSFYLTHFQVVGDRGNPQGTGHDGYVLAWNDAGPPPQEMFGSAQDGEYSRVYIDMNEPIAYDLRGVVRNQSHATPFKVQDQNRLLIQLECKQTVISKMRTAFSIRVDLRNALTGLDFTKFSVDDGVLELKDDDEFKKLRASLMSAFKVED